MNFITQLKSHFPPDQCFTDPADCWVYGYDNSRKHHCPDAVILPKNTQEILTLVALCNTFTVPLTARGRASNTTGAAIPLQGGVVVSLERMDAILNIDPDNRTMTVEPGVLNGDVQTLAREHGFFWAPDPTSAPYCTVGGNLACNAAGPRSLKYGTTRDNVLGLTAVMGTGDIVECGVYTSKGSVGYDLTRLMIGSEGTLGIITQATLKLLPLPEAKYTLRAFYRDPLSAAEAITRIMRQPVTPCACEFIDDNSLKMARLHQGADIPAEAGSMLMIEIDGSPEALDHEIKRIETAATVSGLLDYTIAKTSAEAQPLWDLRKSLSQTLRSLSPHKINEDVVVPISAMPDLIAYTQTLSQQYQIPIVNFGHGGNGNIHVNLLVDPLDPESGPKAQACLNDLFDKVIALRGTLSGEHGIGIEKRDYLNKQLSPNTIALMRAIKSQCDPKGILNPGKLLPD